MHVLSCALDCDNPFVTSVLAPADLQLVLAETATTAVLAIARLSLALFSRQPLALSASMTLTAHARAIMCQATWIVIVRWQR